MLKRIHILILLSFALLPTVRAASVSFQNHPSPLSADSPGPQSPLRVLVLTGGHGFEEKPFYDMFRGLDGMAVDFVEMDPNSTCLNDISRWKYEVIVFYHFKRKITEQGKENLLKLCDKGIGIVALHHALIGFDEWPQWNRIVGAHYFETDTRENGILYPKSVYLHDVTFTVQIRDKQHPICSGIKDFEIVDETYNLYQFDSDNKVLLTTAETSSHREICWTRQFRNSPVCYLQLGHDHKAWQNPNFKKLLTQAIHWAALPIPNPTK